MMRRFQIEIPEHTFEELAELARSKRRPVKAQAAWLIEQVLHQQLPGREPDQEQRLELVLT